jgi:hypothetical protein
MVRRAALLFCGMVLMSGHAWADLGVAGRHSSPQAGVAAKQQGPRAGDGVAAAELEQLPRAPATDEAVKEEAWRPGRPHVTSTTEPARRWYGLPTLVIDVSAVTLLAAGATRSKDALGPLSMALGIGGYLVGGPIVHASHGNWGRGAASVLLRAGLPLATAIVGGGSCSQDSGRCAEELLQLAAIGAFSAVALDLALLHWKPRKDPKPQGLGSVVPQLELDRSSVRLGARGSF